MPFTGRTRVGDLHGVFRRYRRFYRRSDLVPGLDQTSWYANDLDFLAAFYESHAPEEYRDLYLGNVALRQHLDSALDQVRTARQEPSVDRLSPAFGKSSTRTSGVLLLKSIWA